MPEKHWYPPAETHFCDWDVLGKRLRRAICGRLINVSDESVRPTCPDCIRSLEARLADVEAELGREGRR